MIKCNLAVLLAERGFKMADIIASTGIAKNTIRSLYYNESKGIQFDTLETICDYLQVTLNELLIHIPVHYNLTLSHRDGNTFYYFDITLKTRKHEIVGSVEVLRSQYGLEISFSENVMNEIKQYPILLKRDIENNITKLLEPLS